MLIIDITKYSIHRITIARSAKLVICSIDNSLMFFIVTRIPIAFTQKNAQKNKTIDILIMCSARNLLLSYIGKPKFTISLVIE